MQDDLTPVIQLTQFLHIFSSVVRLPQESPFTPDDVTFGIQQPEFDALCGQIVTRMLARKLTRVEEDVTSTTVIPPIKYEQWNE